MAKKKVKTPPQPPPTTYLDDDGTERIVGKVYYEKFKYQGYDNVFMVFLCDGRLIPARAQRDVKLTLTEFIGDLIQFARDNARRHDEE